MATHMRVASAVTYREPLVLWRRVYGAGELRCELLRGDVPARRRVRLVAQYVDLDGVDVASVTYVEDAAEEACMALVLERRIRSSAAARSSPSAPAGS